MVPNVYFSVLGFFDLVIFAFLRSIAALIYMEILVQDPFLLYADIK